MYEKHHEPLISTHKFILRLGKNSLIALAAIALAMLLGMLGYHYFEKMSWVDAFANAAMILSGMGPLEALHTPAGKIFAGLYALFSGLAFIVIMGVIFAPVVHRIFHHFHLNSNK